MVTFNRHALPTPIERDECVSSFLNNTGRILRNLSPRDFQRRRNRQGANPSNVSTRRRKREKKNEKEKRGNKMHRNRTEDIKGQRAAREGHAKREIEREREKTRRFAASSWVAPYWSLIAIRSLVAFFVFFCALAQTSRAGFVRSGRQQVRSEVRN